MTSRPLRIAWLGAGPAESGGVPGVAMELLCGLAEIGHSIDCYLPGVAREVPARLLEQQRIEFVWGTSDWRWNRWYNRTKIGVFVSGMASRAVSSVRLRLEVRRRHEREPYDLIYQFSNIEALSVPSGITKSLPLVMHPETHMAGELKFALAERRLALRSQSPFAFIIAVGVMAVRCVVQRVRIRRASLLICISAVFRDHLVRDYRYPIERTVVVPNPVRLARFSDADPDRALGEPPTVLVLGRIAVRKGIEDVVAVARLLLERGVDVRIRVMGGPSLWSDYTKLLEDLPHENSEFVGRFPPSAVPAELQSSDVLLQASKYEPFGLTVAEALAAGVPVVATSEVGAGEGVDASVLAAVAPGDVAGLAEGIEEMLARLRTEPGQTRTRAREEAVRLFAPDLVAQQISAALEQLVEASAS
jgi:glycosyltransferase involved in cell wall biosynthesis